MRQILTSSTVPQVGNLWSTFILRHFREFLYYENSKHETSSKHSKQVIEYHHVSCVMSFPRPAYFPPIAMIIKANHIFDS